MKITTPAALLSVGLLLNGALVAQDAPAEKPAPAPTPAAPPTATTPPKAPTPPKAAPPKATPPNITPVPAKPPAPKMDPAQIKTYTSYGFGYRNGRNFTNQTGRYGLSMNDVDREQFLKGLFDALELKDSAIEQEKINEALNQLSELIKAREVTIGEKNKVDGEKFLAENKKREGVITTESGLQYEILKEGDGEIYTLPADGQRPNKQFMTIYRGTTIDGTEFDSSKGEPAPMSLNVIAGFKEALTQMPVGSKWKVFIPSDLAYKDARRSAVLGPNSTLVFELELTSIKDLPAPPSRAGARPPGPGGRAVSPPVRAPGRPGARAVSPAVRVPTPPGQPKARAVSPPVRIPTNPTPKPPAPAPAPTPPPAPAPAPEPAPKPGNP